MQIYIDITAVIMYNTHMKYIAIVATNDVDSQNEKYSLNALGGMLPTKEIPVFRGTNTSDVIGHTTGEGILDNGRLYVTFETEENLEGYYAVPGFKVVSTHNEGNVTVYDEVKVMAYSLIETRPADLNLTPLRLTTKYPTFLRYESTVDGVLYLTYSREELHSLSLRLLSEFHRDGRYTIPEELPEGADKWTVDQWQKANSLIRSVEWALELKDGYRAYKCLTLHNDEFFPKMNTKTIFLEPGYNLD